MNIKRFTALLLTAFLTVALFGCEKNRKNVKNVKTLTIGCDLYEPFTYVNENGGFAGIDVDLAKEACKRIDYKPKFVFVKWEDKKSYIENGSVDCLWSCFSMEDRKDEFLWVGPYMYSNQVVAVRSGSSIKSLDDLNGKTIAVQSSTKPEKIILEHKSKNIPVVKNLYCFVEQDEIFAALRKDYVDACAGHEYPLKKFISEFPGKYRILDEPLMATSLGIAFPKDGDKKFAKKLKTALNEMRLDGTVNEILEKYGVETENLPEVTVSDENK